MNSGNGEVTLTIGMGGAVVTDALEVYLATVTNEQFGVGQEPCGPGNTAPSHRARSAFDQY